MDFLLNVRKMLIFIEVIVRYEHVLLLRYDDNIGDPHFL